MKTLVIYKLNLILLFLTTGSIIAQKNYKESFKASNDMVVEVNTSHTNVIFETWNKDKVEVEAYITGEHLSNEEKQELFDAWDFEVLGNSRKVSITSNAGGIGQGAGALAGMEALKSLESLRSLKALENLADMPTWTEMPNFDFDFNLAVPNIPDFEKFPNWPFTKDRPSIKNKDGYMNYNFNNNGSILFDQNKYEKDKKGYVAKLNKKYGTNVRVAEVDNWLASVDQWGDNFAEVMEEWGENFGQQLSEKFGPEWELKMEKWGEEFGEKFGAKMEKWGEEFGEKFGKDMEKWGEEFGEKFGKDMEKWGEEFGKNMEEWAKQFEENADKTGQQYKTTTLFGDDGSKVLILDSKGGKGLFNSEVNKTIIVRMPKGTKTEVNVRYGELKMADARNLKAYLDYAKLTANSIDGGKTLINASYAPVYVNNWNEGVLNVNYVDDCRLNSVKTIELNSNSSDVNINEVTNKALFSGSFGSLFISKIQPSFNSLDIVLENTDAAIDLPDTSFNFSFVGKKSTFAKSKELKIVDSNNGVKTILKGYHKSNDPSKTITIYADYSSIKLQ